MYSRYIFYRGPPSAALALESLVSGSDLCTEAEITAMVGDFYAAVRADALLGPVFARHVQDWDRHLPKMVDFWSSVLRRTARYRGTPMPMHAALPGLDAALFQRWLQLFHATTARLANRAMAARADTLADAIAQSLWYGYQLQHAPGHLPAELA
jgi:hemoglobin